MLAYGREVLPHSRLLTLNRYRLPVMLWRHRNDDALDELLNPLRKVIARDSNGQLLATLRSWCEHDGQSQACADALGIHRNSLRYRMERIAELSGVDPLRPGRHARALPRRPARSRETRSKTRPAPL